ncbi:PBECR3 domain-containing polyvalent protein, partial [Helicobacter felis]
MPLKEEPSPSSAEPDKGGGEGGELPTKSTLAEDLSPAEIKSHIEQWDLTNPKATDRLLIGKVEGKELEQLSQEFKFNGNYALARQIDSKHVAHVMNRHSNPKIETSRNQIPITMEDIANYPNIVKSADIREVEGNRIRYKKQINGHYVVIEEALTKKNKISFVTMWKSKGDIATPRTPSSMGYDLDRTLSRGYQDDPTTPPLKNIEPNPAFGENFSEFEGKGAQAVAKLLQEKRGQVAGAFYREDLGHIDLVWGDSKKGLAHILERRTQQYGEQKALDFINDLPRILQEAKFYKELENKIELVTPTDMIVLGKTDNNKFVLTGFRDRRSKQRFTELENPQTRDDVGFTGKSVSEPQTKDDVLLPNQDNNTKPPLKK